jgi:DNA-binding NtrC family response regulator
MTLPVVLFVGLDPIGGVCRTLRALLVPSKDNAFTLEELRPPGTEPDTLTNAIAELDPCVACLVVTEETITTAIAHLRTLRDAGFVRPILAVTGDLEAHGLFELLKAGVSDFVTVPIRASEIRTRLRWLIDQSGWTETRVPGNALALRPLIGRSQLFVDALQRLPSIARCDATVLISGETGTGKEMFARAIHQLSPRAGGPWVPINCGAIPLELAENELFGHSRGAYTGAVESRPGLVAEADEGTLFLDEVDTLPLKAQVKLLRFLQDKEYRALGSTQTRRVNARVIAATNTDIEMAVQRGKIRRDLYYRLNIVTLSLPPLRHRSEDTLTLANYFLSKHRMKIGKAIRGFTAEAQERLALHDWPGNVRELEHVIERAVILSPGPLVREQDITLRHPLEAKPQSFREAKSRVVQEWEKAYLQGLLLASEGNISRAAIMARKNRRAFWELLRKYHIDAREVKAELSCEDRVAGY